jgi:hypothetical protein
MKKWIVFLLGFIAGVVFTFIGILILGANSNNSNDGITLFEQPGDCLSENQFEVIQALGENYALAYEQEYDNHLNSYLSTDLLVLITNNEGEYYYDNQKINVPKDKCMRQIGIYEYITNSGLQKTVPVVTLMDK